MQYIPFVLIGFGILAFTFLRASKKNVASQKEGTENFWAREREANTTRKKDLSDLNYILFDTKKLPLIQINDTGITRYLSTLSTLSQEKLLNLSGKTNTDLNLEYGRNNLQHLMNCDGNYIKLIQVLHQLGKRLMDLNLTKEAIRVFEIELEYESDILDTYKVLYQHYTKNHQGDKIQELIQLSHKLDKSKQEKILHIIQGN